MIEKLPEGTVIGEMKASLEWVLSHTARFAGVVIINIQESRGFILIDKGKPLAYYFRHGKRVLKGHNAFEYFSSQSHIQFELRRFTTEEMSRALDIVATEDKKTPQMESVFLGRIIYQETAASTPDIVRDEVVSNTEEQTEMASDEPVISREGPVPVYDMTSEQLASAIMEEMTGPEEFPENTGSDLEEEPNDNEFKPPPVSFASDDEVVANVGELLLGQIIGLPGVIAVSIFKRGMNVLSIGDISLENLIEVAEDLIGSAREVSSVMRTGPFVQMTLQIPAGNIIIAPYWDEYLCILTNQEINLGQIRKILREIPAGNLPGKGHYEVT
jgi:hypothetical protein